ncbi:unnamed protein product [Parnassius mnemosyne]|uniref:DDE-1 domain-containing protein n=1 Tax=Parnassius mnemosyne TaxID=213953 RepID=A0AAV1LQS2_9NEOP
MLHNIENGEDTKTLSVLDAILMISEAWEKVTQTTIANCFRHKAVDFFTPTHRFSTDEDDNLPLAQLAAQLHRSTTTEPLIEIEEFIGIDDNVDVCAVVTEEEILAEVESNNRNTDEENEDPQEQFQPTTLCEAINAIIVLQNFVDFNRV